jgi:Asp-tRNA(Asn)/Glu-tRNA(Gln) amidotransferase A subunit family amidase
MPSVFNMLDATRGTPGTAPRSLPDATELARRIRDGEETAVDVVTRHLEWIERDHRRINAATRVFEDEALLEAEAPREGPLMGVPISIKEMIGIAGEAITAVSIRMPKIPCGVDAEAVRRLRAAGGIVIARTNVPEFGMSHETDNLRYGRTNNPIDPRRTAGGSSGGEAALVASGGSAVGLGTDVGGSIRYPAHCCGIVGFKPASGRIDPAGSFPSPGGFISSFRSMGPLARSVRDARLIYSILTDEPIPDADAHLGLPLHVVPDLCVKITDPEVTRALEIAERELCAIGLARTETPLRESGSYYRHFSRVVVRACEKHFLELLGGDTGKPLARWPEAMGHLLGTPTVWAGLFRFLFLSPLVRPSDRAHRESVAFITEWRQRVYGQLGRGLLLLPVAGGLALPHGRAQALDNRPGINRHFAPTALPNTLNLPAISLPVHGARAANGLVPGIQLACRPGNEGTLLSVAAALETALSVG